MPQLANLFRALRVALLTTAFAFGAAMFFDPSTDNRFIFMAVDVPNMWLGVATLVCIPLAMVRKPPYWWLWLYTIVPMMVSLQRCIMIAFNPTQAKLALAVYLGVASFVGITTVWSWWYGITD